MYFQLGHYNEEGAQQALPIGGTASAVTMVVMRNPLGISINDEYLIHKVPNVGFWHQLF